MTEKAIEFLQEWINEKVQAPETPAKIEREAEVLAEAVRRSRPPTPACGSRISRKRSAISKN